MAFLNSSYSSFHLCQSPSPTGPVKLNLTSLALPKGSPSLHNCLPKNNIASSGARATALVIHSLGPPWNMSAISDPLHAWAGGGRSPPSPKVTLMWMQLCIWSSGVIEHACPPSGDRECMEGNLLNYVNLKGTLGDIPICMDTSSNKSWAVSSGSPPWDDRIGDVSLCTPLPALVAFLCLPIL